MTKIGFQLLGYIKNENFLAHLPHETICPAEAKLSYMYVNFSIRVRIDPPHPFVCCKRLLNGAVLRMRPDNPRSRVTVGVAR
jgi:hypothetical protein